MFVFNEGGILAIGALIAPGGATLEADKLMVLIAAINFWGGFFVVKLE